MRRLVSGLVPRAVALGWATLAIVSLRIDAAARSCVFKRADCRPSGRACQVRRSAHALLLSSAPRRAAPLYRDWPRA